MSPRTPGRLALGIVAASIAAAIGAALYVWLPSTLVIDVSGTGTHRLATNQAPEDVHAIRLSGSGEFAGTVKLELLDSGEMVARELLIENGAPFEWEMDWYSAEATVRVTPVTARGGELTLRYRFDAFP